MDDWIRRLFRDETMLRMGHCQRAEDGNLGLGWVYYALARLLRPTTVVVIGSYRGFVPLTFGKALHDNGSGGAVWLIEPSLVDDFWKDPARVTAHFASAGVTNVRHVPRTTQEFVETDDYRQLGRVGLLHVDGMHTEEQAAFDFEAFAGRLVTTSVALFHDSVAMDISRVYGDDRPYVCTVRRFIDRLKTRREWQVFDLPFGPGLTLVRRADMLPVPAR